MAASKRTTQHAPAPGQLELPFNLPYYDNPLTDNKKLLNLQCRYIAKHDQTALYEMYELGKNIAFKLINQATQKNKHIRALSLEEREEKAHNAITYIIEQYIKRPDFVISTSYTGYIYKRIQYELFYHRKIDKKIIYCDTTNHIF